MNAQKILLEGEEAVMASLPQVEFDKYYITASEIARELALSRVAVHYGRQRGVLPNPISVGDGLVYIWKRDEIEPYIKAWKHRSNEKKGLVE